MKSFCLIPYAVHKLYLVQHYLLFIPILFFNNNSIDISISNAYLWGGVGAIAAAYKTKNVYWTIACGGILFIGVDIYF